MVDVAEPPDDGRRMTDLNRTVGQVCLRPAFRSIDKAVRRDRWALVQGQLPWLRGDSGRSETVLGTVNEPIEPDPQRLEGMVTGRLPWHELTEAEWQALIVRAEVIQNMYRSQGLELFGGRYS